MAEFMMLMKGSSDGDWDSHIAKLIESGTFRGGSALGEGVALRKDGSTGPCTIDGFMRFEAESIEVVRQLLDGNPVYEAGGEIELLELLVTP